MKTRCNTNV